MNQSIMCTKRLLSYDVTDATLEFNGESFKALQASLYSLLTR